MSDTDSSDYDCYSRGWYLPDCYFGYVIIPQFFMKPSKPIPCLTLLKKKKKVTKIESQGQPYSLQEDINGGELHTNQHYSLEAPKILLFPRKDQEALEKKLKKMTRHQQNLIILEVFFCHFISLKGWCQESGKHGEEDGNKISVHKPT